MHLSLRVSLTAVALLIRGAPCWKTALPRRMDASIGRCLQLRAVASKPSYLSNYVEVVICRSGHHRDALQMLANIRPHVRLEFLNGSIATSDDDAPLHCIWSAFRGGIQIDSVVLEDRYSGKYRWSDADTASSWNEMIQAKTGNLYHRKVSFGDGGALQSELDSAVSIVQTASYMTRSLQNALKGSLSSSSASKKDYSPVTVADYAAQALIVSYLSEMFPGDGFVAEEDSSILRSDTALCNQVLRILEAVSNRSWSTADLFEAVDRAAGVEEVGVRREAVNISKRRTWVLDPIDGTKGFLRGQHFCIGLGLLIDSKVELSVIGCPNLNVYRSLQGPSYDSYPVDHIDPPLPVSTDAADCLYHENSGSIFFAVTDRGAFARSLSMSIGAAFEIATSLKQSDITLCESAEAAFGNRQLTNQIASSMGVINDFIRIDGMCKHCLVACGAAEGTLRLPPVGYVEKIWDHVAGDHLVREAGGSCTDLRGGSLDFSGGRELDASVDGIVASNGIVHENILRTVRLCKQRDDYLLSESTIDGSLDDDSFTSGTPEPEIYVPESPASPSRDTILDEGSAGADKVEPFLSVCSRLSTYLLQQGYSPLQLNLTAIDTNPESNSAIARWAASVFVAVTEMNEKIYSLQGLVRSLSLSTHKDEYDREALLKEVAELQGRIGQLESRESKAKAASKMSEERHDEQWKSKQSSEDLLKRHQKHVEQQLLECERRSRVKDLELDRLKDKLARVADREREVAAHNRVILQRLRTGDTSALPAWANDRTPTKKSTNLSNVTTSSRGSDPAARAITVSDLVNAFETQRLELFSRNKELELQVQNLLHKLKDLQSDWDGKVLSIDHPSDVDADITRSMVSEDYSKQPSSSNSSSSINSSSVLTPTARQMYDKMVQQTEQLEYLTRQLEVSRALGSEKDEMLNSFRVRASELHEEIENLRLQLDSRPTVRQWTQAQRERESLEERLHDLILLRGESSEIAMWRKHLSTSDRIKVDRRNHELGLWLLDSLPKTTMKEVLQAVCRELDITEISEIQPSLVKLKAVVKAVPRMERFISQVCNFIYERHPTLGVIDGLGEATGKVAPSSEYTMDQVLPILRRWWFAAQRCVELDAFHNRILLELFRRQEILARKQISVQSESTDGKKSHRKLHSRLQSSEGFHYLKQQWEAEGKHQWACKDPEQLFEIVRDLVDFQAEVMHHDQSLVYAEDYIREQPEILVNRIIRHMQYLFEIRSLDGVLPRMNQIYLFVEEMSNFIAATRGIVFGNTHSGVDSSVSNATMFAEVHRRLLSFAQVPPSSLM